jgi:hypothetical protein
MSSDLESQVRKSEPVPTQPIFKPTVAQMRRQYESVSLETYVNRFITKYHADDEFSKIVQQHSQLSGFGKLGLRFMRFFSKSSYEAKVTEMVHQYATIMYDKWGKSIDAKEKEETLEKQQQDAKRIEAAYLEKKQAQQSAQQSASTLAAKQSEELKTISQEASAQVQTIQREEKQSLDEVEKNTDTTAFIQNTLQTAIKQTGLVKETNRGLQFDNAAVMRKLEDLLLEEISGELANEGRSAVIKNIHDLYTGVVSGLRDFVDGSDIPDIDYIASFVEAAKFGRRLPIRSDYLVAEYTAQSTKRAGINTALMFDYSGSMSDNGRWAVAQKLGLATHGLMRQLNPNNQTHLGYFRGDTVGDVTNEQLYRMNRPDNGTPTEKALNWLYKKLDDQGPSIAYLVTDGAPNYPSSAIEAAKKFKDNPYIQLRIFGIDLDKQTTEIVRDIGLAAGQQTKVLAIPSKNLAKAGIAEIAESLKNMQSIQYF